MGLPIALKRGSLMSEARRILGSMDERESNPAWVPGTDRQPDRPDGPRFTATALQMMDESIMVWDEDPDRGAKLAADAGAIFGGGVLLALQDMQVEGVLPPPGTPAWDEFVAMAEAGDMELAVVVMVRDRDAVTTGRVARRLGRGDPKPAAEPIDLAAEMRAMGWM